MNLSAWAFIFGACGAVLRISMPSAEDADERGLAQCDGYGERLLVVEDQRQHPGASAESVAAPRPGV
jgi:hypothetical protein